MVVVDYCIYFDKINDIHMYYIKVFIIFLSESDHMNHHIISSDSDHSYHSYQTLDGAATGGQTDIINMKNCEISKLKRKVRVLQKTVSHLKRQSLCKSKSDKHGQSSPSKISDAIAILKPHFSKYPDTWKFISTQIRLVHTKSRGARWSEEDKICALSLYHASPACYKILRKLFKLPSISTLQEVMTNIDLRPGFHQSIFDGLKTMASNM